MSKANPIDILGDATPDLYRREVEICSESPEFDGLLIMLAPQALTDAADVAIALIEMLQEIPHKLQAKLEFDRPRARTLIDLGLNTKNKLLTEVESKILLSAYGIPINQTEVATSETEAIRISQSMVERQDYELIIGAKKDRDFGPVILFGMGGIMTEVVKDRSLALPPLNLLLARRLMGETKVHQLLKGYRNHPPANLEKLEEILIRLSQLVTDFAEEKELDINPLVVTQNSFCAVDARVILKPAEVKSPLHLLISPYPNQYEARVTTTDNDKIFIRPILPEDAPLLIELFEALSPRSIYNRFFTPLKQLPFQMLARFTQIDYAREIALVAIPEFSSNEKILGVARFILERNLKNAEFSVVVGDPWQGKGIGAELLSRCLAIAGEKKLRKYGVSF